jgi:AraC family transcriptional regulator of adaptative response/methylated-DNA-[protein]-cysteine methyltransferase
MEIEPRQGMTPELGTDQARWEVLLRRDRENSDFVYGVRTTGVYCRPGCASRLPKRENVCFFEGSAEAEQAGFRPCRRCRPDSPETEAAQVAAICQACKTIAESEEPPRLADLAQAAGISPFHFQRLFRSIVGVTPKQYAQEKRLGRAREKLQQGATVTDALYDAGFASSSRFYQQSASALGMKPSDYKRGALGLLIRYAIASCDLGYALVAATDMGICAITLGDSPAPLQDDLRRRFPKAELRADDPGLDQAVTQVLALIESPRRGLDLPLDIRGTAFQRRVWQALQEIPTGTTTSYGELAARIEQPTAARAVAQACAANPISVAIPCHRVRRGNGELGGYHWGLERKRILLERESKKEQ